MRLKFIIINWVIRILYLLLGDPVSFLIAEFVFSCLSVFRFERDELTKVVTGFVGSDDVGHYEYNDNAGQRFFGWIFWILSILLRGFLILSVITNLLNRITGN
jgi:hypothetical protein